LAFHNLVSLYAAILHFCTYSYLTTFLKNRKDQIKHMGCSHGFPVF
jgi:hypothetical protein